MSRLLLGVALMVVGGAIVVVVQRVFLTGSTTATIPTVTSSGGKDYSKFTLPGWEDVVIGRQPPRDIEWTCAREVHADPDRCRGSRPKLHSISEVDVLRRPDMGVIAVSSFDIPLAMKDSLLRRWGKPAHEVNQDGGGGTLTWCSADREVQVDGHWGNTQGPMEVQIRSADEVLLHSSGFHCYERQDTEPNASITQPVAATLAPTNARRTAYVTIGHGEINDAQSVPPSLKSRVPERRTSVFKKRMDDLNFELKDLGNVTLATDVPADAALVLVLAPSVPLQPAEWAALERYLDKGGRIMIALDPKGETGMGSLEGKIGYKYNSTPLTDDKSYLPQRGDPSDRRFPITTKFSSHASTTSLSRSVDKGLVLIESGTFEDTPFTGQSIKDQPTKTVTIRSMDSAFLDFNSNFSFDSGTEKKQNYNVASAIEGPKLATGKHTNGWRVLLFADADLFADVVVRAKTAKSATVIVSGPLLDDSVTWLSGALP